MDSKLTLKLNRQIIKNAKKYAADHKRSLSRIIEAYLKTLTSQETEEVDEIEISPFVKSLKTGIQIPADLDYRSDYLNHLNKKHQ
ncbi:MAG TPA: DUF6364 family protein [Draconibacterium sp.]|nr:DUF6364 family protein [Draconibacterium sp.]